MIEKIEVMCLQVGSPLNRAHSLEKRFWKCNGPLTVAKSLMEMTGVYHQNILCPIAIYFRVDIFLDPFKSSVKRVLDRIMSTLSLTGG